MSGDFIGSYDNSVSNNRITIPAKFKKKFSVAAKETVVVSVGYNNSHIVIFPLDYWTSLSQKFSQGTDVQRLALKSYLDYADDQKVEANGRIRLRPDIMSVAGITKEVIIKGEGDHISVWEPETFRAERERRRRELLSACKETDFLL